MSLLKKIKNRLGRYFFPDKFQPENPNIIQITTPYRPSHGREVNYNSDGLIVLNNCDCLDESNFKNAYDISLSVNDWRGVDGTKMDMRWRYYMVCSFANLASNLEGDFVECGVYKGGYALAIIHYINFVQLNKTFYLLDTFEGLAEQHVSQIEKEAGLLNIYQGYEHTYELVKKTFAPFKTEIIKGAVPDTLSMCKADKICYLSIDMNNAEPEIAALNYFWDKVVSGGIILLDDYGFKAHIYQKHAFDRFAQEKKVNIISLPTGQAIIFKP
jgi:hypothetical protein